MTDVLTLVSTVLSLFTSLGVGVDVDALLARRREEIRALEVYVVGDDPWSFSSCDPGAPAWVIVQIRADEVLVGEERTTPTRVSSWSALQTQLEALKDARRDRDTVLVDVDDDVAFARVVDLLTGVEIRSISLHVTPLPALGRVTSPIWSLSV